MEFRVFNCNFFVSFFFIAFLSLVLFVDTTGIMLFGIISVAIHEAGHLVFMLFCKKMPRKISFQLGGVFIEKQSGICSVNSDILIASGGCVFNFLALLICFSIYAFCGKSQMALLFSASNFSLMLFNVLPINGLDGTDILKGVMLKRFNENKAQNIVNIVSFSFLAFLMIVCVAVVCRTGGNYSLLICFCYLIILTLINIKR